MVIENRVDFLLVARYMRDRGDSTGSAESNLVDGGLRLTWQPSRRLALTAEGLRRWSGQSGKPKTSTRRWGGLVEFQAKNDLYVFYSFGKDFAAKDVAPSPLFANLGLSLGFGQKPAVSLPNTP